MKRKYLIFGDLSGYFDQFISLVKHMPKDIFIIVLGDVPDRGPKTKELIDYLIKNPNVIWIMGNHEHMMVQCYNHVVHQKEISPLYNLPYWIYVNGGDATLKSYGIEVPYLIAGDPKATRKFVKGCSWGQIYNLSVSDTMNKIYSQFNKISQEHISFMENLPLIWENEEIVATHAPVPDWEDKDFFNLKEIESAVSEYNVLWNRNLSYKNRNDGKIHVYGHCNLDKIFAQTKTNDGGVFIDLDTLKVPKDLTSICLDISQTGNILALQLPELKLHKKKMI